MLFHPASDLLWDTWLVEHDGLFYLFYIRVPRSGGPDPATLTMGAGWDAINLATSPDLLHWTERGTVLEKDPAAVWLGTGMIHRSGELFVMNYSEERPAGRQAICFATSPDLLHWDKLPGSDLRPDGVLYQAEAELSADPLPRWDSIGVIPPAAPGGEYLGVLAADQVDPPLAGQCAVLGLLSSADGISWRPLPPATAPGLFPSYEVPEHVEIAGRHYVLFSTNSTAGARFVPGDPLSQGGTYYVVSDSVRGPYVRPPAHPLLHGHRIAGREFATYVGRPLRTSGGELLLYHHWAADPPDGWWGPPKRLVERRPYVLGLDYWPGCEALKDPAGQLSLAGSEVRPLPSAGALPVVTWAVTGTDVVARNAGGAHGAAWLAGPADGDAPDPQPAGRIIETGVRIDAGRGLGLWVRHAGRETMFAACLNAETQQVEFGTLTWYKDGSSLKLDVEEQVGFGITAGVTHQVRLLLRYRYAELYIDDQLVRSFVCRAELDPAAAGFFSDVADGAFRAPRSWPMLT
jgi:beta-fructofuranosidase